MSTETEGQADINYSLLKHRLDCIQAEILEVILGHSPNHQDASEVQLEDKRYVVSASKPLRLTLCLCPFCKSLGDVLSRRLYRLILALRGSQ